MDDNSINKATRISENPNTVIFAKYIDNKAGFSIYISVSGQQEYIMTHRNNTVLYALLKDGISLSELKRIGPKALRFTMNRKHTKKSISSIDHIIKVIDEFVNEELGYVPLLEAV